MYIKLGPHLVLDREAVMTTQLDWAAVVANTVSAAEACCASPVQTGLMTASDMWRLCDAGPDGWVVSAGGRGAVCFQFYDPPLALTRYVVRPVVGALAANVGGSARYVRKETSLATTDDIKEAVGLQGVGSVVMAGALCNTYSGIGGVDGAQIFGDANAPAGGYGMTLYDSASGTGGRLNVAAATTSGAGIDIVFARPYKQLPVCTVEVQRHGSHVAYFVIQSLSTASVRLAPVGADGAPTSMPSGYRVTLQAIGKFS